MGNVLLDYNPEVSLRLFFDNEEDRKIIRKELFEGPEWIQGDLGWMDNGTRYETIKKRIPEHLHPGLKDCVYQWQICMRPLPGARNFVFSMKEKGFNIYVLSNASDTFYEYFPKFLPLDFFDGVMISADVHLIKPDIRIYKTFLEQFHRKPEECLFIDDRKNNVEGAEAAGMRGIIFNNDFQRLSEILHDL
ncbi:MAG: HAD family phosphatase [Lachnospiraceae bacterium]|nr:HAD family phosphatase [Lachnospiraceae bacterium]